MLGKVAIANGKLTYQSYQRIFSGPRWEALAAKGAQTQRVLWASTSTKNPNYRDVIYVEELIGPDTVNTMPPATIDAFRDHGRLRNSLMEDVAGAQKVMDDLARGRHLHERSHRQADRRRRQIIRRRLRQAAGCGREEHSAKRIDLVSRLKTSLPESLATTVKTTIADWQAGGKMQRLWQRDATLWTGSDEANWLGWLDIVEEQTGPARATGEGRERSADARLRAHSPAGHGRVQSVSRSACA